MPEYLSPGVYVEEVPSGMAPIAGVGTSTAGFIGVVKQATLEKLLSFKVEGEKLGKGDGKKTLFPLKHSIQQEKNTDYTVEIRDIAKNETTKIDNPKIINEDGIPTVKFNKEAAPKTDQEVFCTYTSFHDIPDESEPILCTNFTEFKKHFGDFYKKEIVNNQEVTIEDTDQKSLALAVHGFFANGGTRCWVSRVEELGNIQKTLDSFKTIDDIAIVAVPGQTDNSAVNAVITHCEKMQDRFAVIDGLNLLETSPDLPFTVENVKGGIRDSNFAAIYFPWIVVKNPVNNEPMLQPPSGHIAGVYARVDKSRGVHKAPANETIRGCIDFTDKYRRYRLSKAMHDGLNPKGINVIRSFSNTPTVWGARTIGGDDNGEWKYINVRRLFLFLRESIEEGTRWVVMEPNTYDLWAKITRNITAFLTNVWRSGALFGRTSEEAFYVKCDAETNPQAIRDEGKVVTEIGVAVVKPAEFVIFRISQWSGGGTS